MKPKNVFKKTIQESVLQFFFQYNHPQQQNPNLCLLLGLYKRIVKDQSKSKDFRYLMSWLIVFSFFFHRAFIYSVRGFAVKFPPICIFTPLIRTSYIPIVANLRAEISVKDVLNHWTSEAAQ